MTEKRFKLLYDSQCPFCKLEAEWLKRLDKRNAFVLEDIAATDFDPARYGLTYTEVTGILHGILPDGRIVRKMDALRGAYRAAGIGWVMAPTAWPGLRWFFDRLYALFARHRVRLGRLFGRNCDGGTCAVGVH